MSQTKVQLIAPIGVVTATTLETTGVLTATTFVGDIAGTVTGITSTTDNLNLGIITATSFAGDFTGIGSGLTGTPNVVAGIVTATKFVGNTPGLVSGIADGTNINAGIITATSFVGNLTGNAAGLSTTTAHVNLGIVTATSYSGSGANLEGVSSGPVAQQAVTANGSTTTIDLSSGNLIYMTQSANTTVAFANTEGNTDTVYLVRTKDDTTTARTITWPSGIVWNGESEPTLLNSSLSGDAQVFKLTTRDNGATWYGAEVVNNGSGYELWVWGENRYGCLGLNQPENSYYSSPVQIPGTTWYKSASGNLRTFAVKSEGTLWAWGSNEHGCLGLNQAHDVSHRSSPTQIPGTTWSTVDSDVQSTIALKTDNTLWGWGADDEGDLGQNEGPASGNTKYSSPVQIPGTTWSKAFRGKNFNTAIKTDGTLWGWGTNYYGQLGQNTSGANSKYSSPVQVPGTTWATATASISVSHAIKTDGTLWSMGENHVGQLGLNNVISYSSPVQIPGTTWSTLSSSSYQALGIKTNGTLWGWGNNGKGQLGQNDIAQRSSPVQIPGTNWAATGHAMTASYGIKTDGTLWVWGYNTNGPLGQNNRTDYSSPVQVPGTWVTTARAAVQSGINNEHLALLKNP